MDSKPVVMAFLKEAIVSFPDGQHLLLVGQHLNRLHCNYKISFRQDSSLNSLNARAMHDYHCQQYV